MIKVSAHTVHLEVGAQQQEVGKVDPARAANGTCHGIVDVNYH